MSELGPEEVVDVYDPKANEQGDAAAAAIERIGE